MIGLIDLIFTTPQSTIFQLRGEGSSWVEPVLSKAPGNNTVTQVSLDKFIWNDCTSQLDSLQMYSSFLWF